MASSVEESEELIRIAKENKLTLMVDHTYLYSSSIRRLKELLTENDSKILHIESNRSNLGLFRNDVDVIWDLAPHDLSIIEYVSNEKPKMVSAVGYSHNDNGIIDTAYLSLVYDSFSAGVKVSWISPTKIRQFDVVTNKEMIVFNDLLKEGKIEIHSSGFKKEGRNIVCWNDGMKKITTDEKEPLSSMVDDFITSLTENKCPISDSTLGIDVVRILESASLSIQNSGQYITIDYGEKK